MRLLEDISFIFKDAKADEMVEATHLRNEPWDRTLKQKGEFKKIDYMLSIDSDVVSLPYDEAKERMQERSEMFDIFGKNSCMPGALSSTTKILFFTMALSGKICVPWCKYSSAT